MIAELAKETIKKKCLSFDPEELRKAKSQITISDMEVQVQSGLNREWHWTEENLDLEICKKHNIMLGVDKQAVSQESQVENTEHTWRSS